MEKNRIENINLHDLVENQDNPRTIEPQQMQKLVESILTFPKMLQMRPIVCNENRVILGGNMRFRALLNIEQMEDEAIKGAIEAVAVKLTDGEQQQLCSHWEKWKAEPQVEVVIADSLSEEETDEFIIKDNVYFGSWDEEKLKGAFDVDDMQRWGLNPWEIQQEAATYEPPSDEEQRIIIVYRSEDAHFKELCHNGSCCGLPPTWNYSRGQMCEALNICKRKGYVRWSDIKLDAENLLRAKLEKAMNLGTREKASKYYTMSAADYMKWCWNNPQAAHSPYKMFEGAMVPADERDSEGNIVYKYNGAKF